MHTYSVHKTITKTKNQSKCLAAISETRSYMAYPQYVFTQVLNFVVHVIQNGVNYFWTQPLNWHKYSILYIVTLLLLKFYSLPIARVGVVANRQYTTGLLNGYNIEFKVTLNEKLGLGLDSVNFS